MGKPEEVQNEALEKEEEKKKKQDFEQEDHTEKHTPTGKQPTAAQRIDYSLYKVVLLQNFI